MVDQCCFICWAVDARHRPIVADHVASTVTGDGVTSTDGNIPALLFAGHSSRCRSRCRRQTHIAFNVDAVDLRGSGYARFADNKRLNDGLAANRTHFRVRSGICHELTGMEFTHTRAGA